MLLCIKINGETQALLYKILYTLIIKISYIKSIIASLYH